MLILMHYETPLAISGNEIHEMRGILIDAGYRARGIPDIEVVREFAKHCDLEAFLRKMRTGDARPPSQADPMNDFHAAFQTEHQVLPDAASYTRETGTRSSDAIDGQDRPDDLRERIA